MAIPAVNGISGLIVAAIPPSIGLIIYGTTADIMACSISDVVKDGWPFYLAVILVVAIMVFFPDAVLFLPNLVYGPNGG